MGTSELWAIAKVTRHSDPSWRYDIDLALRLSHHSPLVVSYDSQDEREVEPASEHARSEEFMDVVGRRACRWKSAFYYGHCSRSVVSVLERSCLTLEDLDIIFSDTSEHHQVDGPGNMQINFPPDARLRHIKLVTAVLTWGTLSGLHTLCISHVAESIPRARELLRALRACPRLQVLKLSYIHLPQDAEADEHLELADRLVRDPERHDGRLHLPDLRTLHVHDVHAGFFRALITNVRAETMRCLYWRTNVPPSTTLSETDASFLISPALNTVVTQTRRLYITVTRDSVALHSDVTSNGEVPDVRSPCSFNFELVKIGGGLNYGAVMESMTRLLGIRTLSTPLHVRLGHQRTRSPWTERAAGAVPWTFTLPFSLLEAMPTLTELQIHPQLVNASSILELLSTPIRNIAGELVWPCPQLTYLHVDSAETTLVPPLLSFIAGRCCPREGGSLIGYPSPIPLSSLSLRGGNQHLFVDIAGVGEVILL